MCSKSGQAPTSSKLYVATAVDLDEQSYTDSDFAGVEIDGEARMARTNVKPDFGVGSIWSFEKLAKTVVTQTIDSKT